MKTRSYSDDTRLAKIQAQKEALRKMLKPEDWKHLGEVKREVAREIPGGNRKIPYFLNIILMILCFFGMIYVVAMITIGHLDISAYLFTLSSGSIHDSRQLLYYAFLLGGAAWLWVAYKSIKMPRELLKKYARLELEEEKIQRNLKTNKKA